MSNHIKDITLLGIVPKVLSAAEWKRRTALIVCGVIVVLISLVAYFLFAGNLFHLADVKRMWVGLSGLGVFVIPFMGIVDSSMTKGSQKPALFDELNAFAQEINRPLQWALLFGTQEQVDKDLLKGKEKFLFLYHCPMVCAHASLLAKLLLLAEFGSRLKDIRLVSATFREAEGNLCKSHIWLEIETFGGRRYYLSFTDGQFDHFTGKKLKWINLYDPHEEEDSLRSGFSEKYLEWYYTGGHDYFTLLDITDDEVYRQKRQSLGLEGEVIQVAEKEFDLLYPKTIDRIQECFDEAKYNPQYCMKSLFTQAAVIQPPAPESFVCAKENGIKFQMRKRVVLSFTLVACNLGLWAAGIFSRGLTGIVIILACILLLVPVNMIAARVTFEETPMGINVFREEAPPYFANIAYEINRIIGMSNVRGQSFLELGPGHETSMIDFLHRQGAVIHGVGYTGNTVKHPLVIHVGDYFKDYLPILPDGSVKIIYGVLSIYPRVIFHDIRSARRMNPAEAVVAYGELARVITADGAVIVETYDSEIAPEPDELKAAGLYEETSYTFRPEGSSTRRIRVFKKLDTATKGTPLFLNLASRLQAGVAGRMSFQEIVLGEESLELDLANQRVRMSRQINLPTSLFSAGDSLQLILPPALRIVQWAEGRLGADKKIERGIIPAQFNWEVPGDRLALVTSQDQNRQIIFNWAMLTRAPPLIAVVTLAEEILHYYLPKEDRLVHELIDRYIQENCLEEFRGVLQEARKAHIFLDPKEGNSATPSFLALLWREMLLVEYGIYSEQELKSVRGLYRSFEQGSDLADLGPYQKILIWQYMVLTKISSGNEDIDRRIEAGDLCIGYTKEHWISRLSPEEKRETVRKNKIIKAEDRVLDIGCGEGNVIIDVGIRPSSEIQSSGLAVAYPQAQFVGIDAHPLNIARTIDRLIELRGEAPSAQSVKFHLRDCRGPISKIFHRGIPYENNTFQVIMLLEGVMDEVSCSVEDRKLLWREAVRVTQKPGGKIVFFGLEGGQELRDVLEEQGLDYDLKYGKFYQNDQARDDYVPSYGQSELTYLPKVTIGLQIWTLQAKKPATPSQPMSFTGNGREHGQNGHAPAAQLNFFVKLVGIVMIFACAVGALYFGCLPIALCGMVTDSGTPSGSSPRRRGWRFVELAKNFELFSVRNILLVLACGVISVACPAIFIFMHAKWYCWAAFALIELAIIGALLFSAFDFIYTVYFRLRIERAVRLWQKRRPQQSKARPGLRGSTILTLTVLLAALGLLCSLAASVSFWLAVIGAWNWAIVHTSQIFACAAVGLPANSGEGRSLGERSQNHAENRKRMLSQYAAEIERLRQVRAQGWVALSENARYLLLHPDEARWMDNFSPYTYYELYAFVLSSAQGREFFKEHSELFNRQLSDEREQLRSILKRIAQAAAWRRGNFSLEERTALDKYICHEGKEDKGVFLLKHRQIAELIKKAKNTAELFLLDRYAQACLSMRGECVYWISARWRWESQATKVAGVGDENDFDCGIAFSFFMNRVIEGKIFHSFGWLGGARNAVLRNDFADAVSYFQMVLLQSSCKQIGSQFFTDSGIDTQAVIEELRKRGRKQLLPGITLIRKEIQSLEAEGLI
ncbi:MAG: class I SAM-dependent methyltransferase, partial [Candidatus Omnitrophica bacterium]|nr:class I SAM-dependent methyltransferase [Candidatus Omnitrophota bacterium]